VADVPRCPYCRTVWEADEAVTCAGCSTVSHRDCWAENGGCAVLGCARSPEALAATRAQRPAPPGSGVPASPATPVARPAPALHGAPPGWHPDPFGGPGLRWWDGTAWTGHLHPR